MASPYAFVSLLTSDAYLQGALTLVAALRDVHSSPAVAPEVDFVTVCLVTPETVDVASIKLLRGAFDVVIGVEVITKRDDNKLELLGRPDLDTVLTKLHVFRLTQYSKIIFLDADVLPIRPLSHLFTLPHEFSAVPDVGWPDIFNSGVLVLSPGQEKFDELNQLLKSKGSWDGGDQGILNEWRGNNWHRLSFTYNTTPTAAYTYAPAYERYGSKISAIHFIGSNKPWKSTAYRAPFQQGSSTDTNSQPAYDYDSLVDRWFAVYDKHYRSQPLISDSTFEVKRYPSAWENSQNSGTVAVVGSDVRSSGTPLGLEDLRRLAIEGIGSTGFSFKDVSGDGEYKSLPLEGRFDLMRRPELSPSDLTPTQADHAPSYQFPPTPGPNEVPPSPRLQPVSLPSTPGVDHPFSNNHHAQQHKHHHYQHEDPNHHQRQHHRQHDQHQHKHHHHHHQHENQNHLQRQHSHQHVQQQHEHHQHQDQHENPNQHQDQHENPNNIQHQHNNRHQHHDATHVPQEHHDGKPHHPQPRHAHQQRSHTHVPHRPASPPKMLWNPAIEPPPTTAPPPSAFPTDTYFPNIWDKPRSRQHDQPHEQHTTKPSDSGSLFRPPPTPQIPESLRMQGHYRQVTGDSAENGHTPSPDPGKVKSVFPWENKPRQMPSRTFPESEAPVASKFLSPQSSPSVISDRVPIVQSPPSSNPVSPNYGLPKTLAFTNAWDHDPSIQMYAQRLVRPPPPLAPAFDSNDWKKGGTAWNEKVEASSMDGDDEDDGENDEDEQPRWVDDSDHERTSGGSAKARSRRDSESISASYLIKGKKKEYRVRGVQTDPRPVRSQGVQANTNTTVVSQPQSPQYQSQGSHARITSASFSRGNDRKHWVPSHGTRNEPVVVLGDVESSMTTAARSPLLANRSQGLASLGTITPPDQKSPREFQDTPTAKANPILTNGTVMSSPESPEQRVRGTIDSPSVSRQVSNDGSSLASPPSSVGPLSPPEGQPPLLPGRKAARVWDPARGVELFKRGSEEVLARFLNMRSWEDEGARA